MIPKRTKSLIVLLCAVLVLAGSFASVFARGAAEEAPVRNELRVAVPANPDSLDASIAAVRHSQNVSWQIFDSLVFQNDDLEIEPALAESWEVSEDGTKYTFTLRRGVEFHNGEPFDAHAVVYSWERGRAPGVQWRTYWNRAKEVEAVDDYTVVVRTEEPDVQLLTAMAQHWNMVAPEYAEEVGLDAFSQAPVGTGPFVFVEWIQEERVVLEANENYWREGLPYVDKVIFRPIPESSTRVAAVQTDEIDIVNQLSYEQAMQLEGNPGIEVINYPLDRVYYITFNNLTSGVGEPTENKLVRQAMNYAVDIDAIINALFGGFATPATGLITEFNLGFDPDLDPYPYDPEKAMELLAEAGYPDGFSMGFAAPSGVYANFEEVVEAIQGYLGDVGIETDLEIMESGRFWDLEASKELPPLFGDSWSERGEALPRLIGALGGWDAPYSAWSDPVIDDYIAQIQVTVDDNERAALYRELQHYMYEDPPFIYLYMPETFEAVRSRVMNYRPRGAEDYYLMDVYIEGAGR